MSTLGSGCNDGRSTSADASPADAQPVDAVATVVLTPDEIFGRDLDVWLDADYSASVGADGGSVVRWRSRTTPLREFVATYPLLPYNGITIDPSVANGHPAIHVGGQRGILRAEWGGAFFNMVVAIVASYTNPPANSGVMFMMSDKWHGDAYLRGNAMGKSIVMGGVGGTYPGTVWSATEGWNDGKLHTFGFRTGAGDFAGGAAIRVDGAQWGKAGWLGLDANGVLMLGGLSCVWCDAGTTPIEDPLEGYIAEVIVAVNTAGTPTQIAQLSAYFQKKYGIPF